MANDSKAAAAAESLMYFARANGKGQGWYYRDPRQHNHGPFNTQTEALLKARKAFGVAL